MTLLCVDCLDVQPTQSLYVSALVPDYVHTAVTIIGGDALCIDHVRIRRQKELP